jgi:hypothetical protein
VRQGHEKHAKEAECSGVDAEPPVDGRGQVARGDGLVGGVRADAVAGAVDCAALHPAARQQHRVAIGPVVAATVAVDLGRAAELAHRQNGQASVAAIGMRQVLRLLIVAGARGAGARRGGPDLRDECKIT